MLWVTWRQYRTQAITTAMVIVAVGIVLGYTGPHLAHLYNTSGISACQASGGDCGPLIDDFTSHYRLLHGLSPLIVLIPGVVGVFWGAPLVARELETGTFRLAWTQSVTRTRWLATKLAVIGAATVATTVVFEVMIAWWQSPIDKVSANRFSPGMFDQRGVVPAAYAVFAFALGVLLGVLIRRTLAAMAATIAGFGAVRFAIQDLVRPHFATAQHLASPLIRGDFTIAPGAWVVSQHVIDSTGRTVRVRRDLLQSRCGLAEGQFSRNAVQTCAQRLGLQRVLTVQPAGRYWGFQLWEAGIFVVLAAGAVVACFWWVRRHLT